MCSLTPDLLLVLHTELSRMLALHRCVLILGGSHSPFCWLHGVKRPICTISVFVVFGLLTLSARLGGDAQALALDRWWRADALGARWVGSRSASGVDVVANVRTRRRGPLMVTDSVIPLSLARTCPLFAHSG